MDLQIPHIVEVFFAAERMNDAKALASCFAENGIVHDEAYDHIGHAAIQQWKEEADLKYSYTSEPRLVSTDGDTVTVRSLVKGNFPGSPIELTQLFKINNARIVSLEIHS